MSSVQQANRNYTQAEPYIKLMRDSIVGEPALKAKQNQRRYLPSPVCDDADPTEEAHRYHRYITNAEYDNIPSATLDALQGALSHQPNNYDGVPAQMAYLVDDADGDGLSLDEHVKIAQAELLQMKFCGLLAEYSDLSSLGVGDEQLTVAQVQALGLRSNINLYPSDSILDWDFKRINGVKQLSYILLREMDTEQNTETFTTEEVLVYLRLCLDADGKYYQQRMVETSGEWSEPFYPEMSNGSQFEFIPFEFAVEGNYPKGKIPDSLGYLFAIATKSLARYNVNAQMKEALWFSGAPVSWSSGWDEMAFKTYKEMTGKDYISAGAGAHVPLPEGAQYGVMDWKAESSAFFTYLDRNAKEIQALGGSFDVEMDNQDETATAKVIDAAEKMSVLSSMQSGLEKAYNRVISYCAMFEGVNAVSDIKLNREFMGVKLTPQERDAIRNDYIQGLIGREEALNQLEKGGVLTVKAADLLNNLELSGE